MKQESVGDLTARLMSEAEKLRTEEPDSIYAYALSRSLGELDTAFDDEQGIPSQLYEDLSIVYGPILHRLAETQATAAKTKAGESALRDLLLTLNNRRVS
jgi:hypothetical protein